MRVDAGLRGLDRGAEGDRIGDAGQVDVIDARAFDAQMAIAQHAGPRSSASRVTPSMLGSATSKVFSVNRPFFSTKRCVVTPISVVHLRTIMLTKMTMPTTNQPRKISASQAFMLYHQWKCARAISVSPWPSDFSI